MNLVSTIMSLLAPAIINKIAGSLGMNQGLAGKAISAAIPAILAALTGAASRSGGASALSNVLAKQDPGILGNLGNLIGGSNQDQLVSGGTSMLSSLLGGSSTSLLSNAVGKFAGIDSNQSGSLLGMLAPMVMGQLAQTQRASGLDANGVASLLNSQKDNISAAMPAGFSNLLQGSGLLDSITGAARPAAPMHVAPASGGGLGKWIIPLVLALAAAYLLSTYGCSQHTAEKASAPEAPAVTAPAATTPAAPVAATPALPAVGDLAGMASKALGALTTTLGTVTDEATAKAAVPALSEAGKQIDGLKLAAAALSGDARKPIASLIAGALPGLTQAVEKAVGIPGVGAILNPVLQPVVANLDALSK